ncbi:MAG: transporter substrate-binding domain-containing protein [Chromatocurvus sp.]
MPVVRGIGAIFCETVWRRWLGSFLCIACLSVISPLSAQSVLRVGMTPGVPPLHYYSEGRLVGVDPDSAKTLAEILSRRLELVPLPAAQLRPALRNGDIDVIMSGLVVEDAANSDLMFTRPYLRAGQMAILHESAVARFAQPWAVYQEDVRIGVRPGSAGAAFAERELRDATIRHYAGSDAAFAALRDREIDLFIDDAATSWSLAASEAQTDVISLYRPLTEEHLAWAVSPGNPGLLRDLNQALNLMRANGTLDYIIDRWIPVQVADVP